MIGGLLSGLFGPAQRLQQPGGILGMAGNGYPMAGPFPMAPGQQQPMQQPMPTQQPMTAAQGPGAAFRDFMAPSNAMPIAAALLSGQSNAQNFGNAFAVAGHNAGEKKKKNKTLEWLQQNDPEVAAMVEATGMDLRDAFAIHKQRTEAQKPGDHLKAVGGHIYDTSSGEWISPPAGAAGADGTHGTPFFTRDADGNLHVNFATKDGSSLVRASPGEGEQVLGPYDTSLDRSRGASVGKGEGEAMVTYRSMTSKMPGLEQVVANLDDLAEKATYTTAGKAYDWTRRQLDMEPREAAIARAEYTAIVDNQILPLLRDTFGAQFTQKEGETLRATLGDPDKSPAEKQALLKAFIEQKRRDITALAAQAGIDGGAQPGGQAAPQRYRFNPETGQLE